MFERAGVPVFDADAVVRQLQGPGGGLVEKIGELFPGRVRCGTLDRDCLAQIVLADPAETRGARAARPSRGARSARSASSREHPSAPALVFEIPLLFETGSEKEFDKVVVVSAPPEVQRARVLAAARNDAQPSSIRSSPGRCPTKKSASAPISSSIPAATYPQLRARCATFSLVSESAHGR